jgi:hypothetical protein
MPSMKGSFRRYALVVVQTAYKSRRDKHAAVGLLLMTHRCSAHEDIPSP